MSLEFLEYEEKVGWLWHRLIGEPTSWPSFPVAAVELEGVRGTLAVFFRGVGGEPGLELAAAGARRAGHRLRLRQRLGMVEERMARAERTEKLVLLPPRLDLLPEPGLNRDLYFWLTAFLAHAHPPDGTADPLRADLARLRAAHEATIRLLALFPGLRPVHRRLAAALLELWPKRRLPALERRVESVAKGLLGAPDGDPELLAVVMESTYAGALPAGGSYKLLLPVPLWGEIRPDLRRTAAEAHEDDEPGLERSEDPSALNRRGRRREREGPDGRGALTLINKGELLLLATEMANVARPDDEEDPDAARRAAEDMDELALGSRDRRSSSRLKLQLDIDTAAVDAVPARAKLAYPEWDYKRRAYLENHCALIAGPAPEEGESWEPDDAARRQIRRVRRQFEALRPRRETLRAQLDGHELDTDALVRSRVDLMAGGGVGSDAVFLEARNRARDLAVAILVDASLSTDSWLEGRRVLDVEKQALTALASGIDACGDPSTILAFTSRRREVRVQLLKGFDEPLSGSVHRRIAALRPGQYTRMGAALRHTAAQLEARSERHRLLVLLSDGKPNDVDHYEGRYALEDTRKAVQEARRQGIAVFAVAVDRTAEGYVPHLFGRGGYAIVAHVGSLPDALPRIYRQVAG